jgi:segregation and condensation protein B
MPELKIILEAALLAAEEPIPIDRLLTLFREEQRPSREAVRAALQELHRDYTGRGVELIEVASGFRLQVPQSFAPWVSRLWQERPARYSTALLETLTLIAYRQPITRGEIEEVRGVSINSTIIKTLLEREWIKIVGHREIPGRPGLYATTRTFLDYFNLKSLDELPPLAELRNFDTIDAKLGGYGVTVNFPPEFNSGN